MQEVSEMLKAVRGGSCPVSRQKFEVKENDFLLILHTWLASS